MPNAMELSEALTVLSVASGPLPVLSPSQIKAMPDRLNDIYRAGLRQLEESEANANRILAGIKEDRAFLLRAYTVAYVHLIEGAKSNENPYQVGRSD